MNSTLRSLPGFRVEAASSCFLVLVHSLQDGLFCKCWTQTRVCREFLDPVRNRHAEAYRQSDGRKPAHAPSAMVEGSTAPIRYTGSAALHDKSCTSQYNPPILGTEVQGDVYSMWVLSFCLQLIKSCTWVC